MTERVWNILLVLAVAAASEEVAAQQIVVPEPKKKPVDARCVPRKPHAWQKTAVPPAVPLPEAPVPGPVSIGESFGTPQFAKHGGNSNAVLRSRIDRLRELLEIRDAVASPSIEPESTTQKPKTLPVVQTPVPAIKSEGSSSEKQPQLATTSPSESQPVELPSSPDVVTTPVNRLKLADNLFGAGKVDLALKVYLAIDQGSLSESDQAWVEFQIASCHRRLGDRAKAEKHYRIVASFKSGGTIVETSRWWLDRIHEKQQLTVALDRLTTIVDALEEQKNGT